MTATIKPDANQPLLTQPAGHPSSNRLSRRAMIKQAGAGLTLPLTLPFLVSACQTHEAPRPKITKPGGMVNLGVAAVDVINDYKTPSDAIYIDQIFTPSPAQQMTDWANTKLLPLDDRGNLLVTITAAEMTERDIQSDDGLKALFTNEQRLLVAVKLEGIFSFSHPENNRSATLTVQSEAQSSIADNTSPVDADAIRLRVIHEAMGLFDQEFRRQLRAASSNGWPLL